METRIETLFEDESLLIVSKPVGLVIDAGAERSDLNIDLIGHLGDQGKKVFAFHRLDKDTSGLVLLGKSRKYAKEITALFEEKKIRKAYMAVVHGSWEKNLNRADQKIGDRESLTTFRTLVSSAEKSWIEALPKTGRKHQIRIHCSLSGHPILGDVLYGSNISSGRTPGHALHAYSLSFRHPGSGTTVAIKSAPETWKATWLQGLQFEKSWASVFPNKETK